MRERFCKRSAAVPDEGCSQAGGLMAGQLPLAGKTVWHTRPLDVAEGLARRCRALGATVLTAPVLDIRPLPAQHPAMRSAESRLSRLAHYDTVIFVSANAVRHGLAVVDRLDGGWPECVQCLAIGDTTRRMLGERGIVALQAAGARMNTEALLELPQLQQLSGRRMLIVRGLGGRTRLASALRERGAEVDYAEVYQRLKSGTLAPEIAENIAAERLSFVTAASGESVEKMLQLVDERLHLPLCNATVVVPGERVAAVARRRGFVRVAVAVNAGDEAMTRAILGAINQTRGKKRDDG